MHVRIYTWRAMPVCSTGAYVLKLRPWQCGTLRTARPCPSVRATGRSGLCFLAKKTFYERMPSGEVTVAMVHIVLTAYPRAAAFSAPTAIAEQHLEP
ncbi:hypothetical protein GY45DRAFT_1168390 [Cubamyces sp. BRFM 1775]|nr:hypothetical protein GY45DRAFT_1168390 [Cubamyces sp. BRFM 1775]